MLDTAATPVIWLALILGYSGGIAAAWGPFASFMARLFDTRVRYSGTAFSLQLSEIFFGGALAPSIAVLLYRAAGGPELVAAYMAAARLLSAVCSLLISDFLGNAAEERIPHAMAGREAHS